MSFQWMNPSDKEILNEQKLQPAHFVWRYFLKLTAKPDRHRAKCSICKSVVSYKANISNLSLHLDRQHFLSTRRLREELQLDQSLENASYEQDYWVKPPKEEIEDRRCIVCGVAREREEKIVISKGEIVKQEVSSEKPAQEADKLLSVFKVVCKKIEVPLRCIKAWDFRNEDLPFCKHCTGIATSIYEKQQEVEKLEDQIKGLATNVKDLIWDTADQFPQSQGTDQVDVERTVNFRSFVLDNFAREALEDAEEATEEHDNGGLESITIEDDDDGNTNDSGKLNEEVVEASGENNEADDVEFVDHVPADASSDMPAPKRSSRRRALKRKKIGPVVDVESDEEYVPEEEQLRKERRAEKKKKKDDNAGQEQAVRAVSLGNNKFSYMEHEFQQVLGEGENSKESFICLSCPPGRTYCKRYGVIGHIKMHHLNQTFMCFTCGAGLPTLSRLKRHEQSHLEGNQKRCICCECEKGFATTVHLKRHLLDIHRLRLNVTCDTCGSLFRTDSDLRDHCVEKHSEKSIFCDHCGKGLKDEEQLNEHKTVHINHKFFKCMHCSACFLQKENAMKHFTEKHNAFFQSLQSTNGNDPSSANVMDSIDELLQ